MHTRKTRDILFRAKRELSTHKWVQNAYAVDEHKRVVNMSSNLVDGMCLGAAIWRAWFFLGGGNIHDLRTAQKAVNDAIPKKYEGKRVAKQSDLLPGKGSRIYNYNEQKGRTFTEIIEIINKAIGD